MSNSIIVEQATILMSQIIDDYERLQKELLAINIEKSLENQPTMFGPMTLAALNNIRTQTQSAFMFVESMRLAVEDTDDTGTS